MDIEKVNEFDFLNEELQFTGRWSQCLVNARSTKPLILVMKQKQIIYSFEHGDVLLVLS